MIPIFYKNKCNITSKYFLDKNNNNLKITN